MLRTVSAFERIGEENAFAVLARATQLAAQGRDIINLGIGQPDFRTPDFIVEAALVSRVHCRFTATKDGELEVRDLESTNGTFVNGQKTDVARLEPGDKVQIGRLEVVALRDSD